MVCVCFWDNENVRSPRLRCLDSAAPRGDGGCLAWRRSRPQPRGRRPGPSAAGAAETPRFPASGAPVIPQDRPGRSTAGRRGQSRGPRSATRKSKPGAQPGAGIALPFPGLFTEGKGEPARPGPCRAGVGAPPRAPRLRPHRQGGSAAYRYQGAFRRAASTLSFFLPHLPLHQLPCCSGARVARGPAVVHAQTAPACFVQLRAPENPSRSRWKPMDGVEGGC